jgi:hypothetical protein
MQFDYCSVLDFCKVIIVEILLFASVIQKIIGKINTQTLESVTLVREVYIYKSKEGVC